MGGPTNHVLVIGPSHGAFRRRFVRRVRRRVTARVIEVEA